MIYVFDLDGTLVTETKGDYAKASAIYSRREQVRELYKKRNTIIIQTARAACWEEFTKLQLELLEIPYHVPSVGQKIYGDVYVDDKAINDKDFFK